MADEPTDSGRSTRDVAMERAILFTSDAALSFEEARAVTGRRGATVVFLMGEVGAGKTTLLVELWSLLLLHGSICGHCLAGSRTALALEERAYLSRLEAGIGAATTMRTDEDKEGFLHLRLRRPDGVMRELLFADVGGERLRRIREGRPLLEELPWATRVDRFLVIVDGERFATAGGREVVLTRVRRQIYGLQSCRSISATARVAIGLTKLDKLSEGHRDMYAVEEGALLEEVRRIDNQATALRMAARPADGSPTLGMDSLVEWVCGADRLAAVESGSVSIAASRSIGRIGS